jgi:hypothetical protein
MKKQAMTCRVRSRANNCLGCVEHIFVCHWARLCATRPDVVCLSVTGQ